MTSPKVSSTTNVKKIPMTKQADTIQSASFIAKPYFPPSVPVQPISGSFSSPVGAAAPSELVVKQTPKYFAAPSGAASEQLAEFVAKPHPEIKIFEVKNFIPKPESTYSMKQDNRKFTKANAFIITSIPGVIVSSIVGTVEVIGSNASVRSMLECALEPGAFVSISGFCLVITANYLANKNKNKT
jgi:hypothetical protein